MRFSCVWALSAIVVICWLALAAGETRIEVDENGDEYELKRFYIQGRQLNGSGSKSQCVVTRRKRASRALTLPAGSVAVSSQQLSVSLPEHREQTEPLAGQQVATNKRRYLALAAVQLAEDEEEEEDDDDEEEEEEAENDEEADEQQLEDDVQELYKEQTEQKQFQSQSSSSSSSASASSNSNSSPNSFVAAHLPQGVSVLANAASHANVGADAGIVVIESQQPPKVNPQTHAVFELKPLSPRQQLADYAYWAEEQQLNAHDADVHEEDADADADADVDDDDDFYYGNGYQGLGLYDEYEQFISEDSPVSTEAIWSTGGDEDIHPVINEANQRPLENKNKKKKKQQRQQQKRKQSGQKTKKRKQQQQQLEKKKKRRPELAALAPADLPEEQQQLKRKKQQQSDGDSSSISDVDKQKPGSSSGSGSGSSSPVKRRKAKPSKRQKKRKQSNAVNKRRRPSSSSGSGSGSSSVRPMGGYRRRRPQQTEAQRRRRLQQKRRRQQQQQQQRRRRRRNKIRNQGNGTGNRNGNRNGNGNRRQQYFGDEPIINCIYINKDPPATTTTTTARPFWNILGREAAAQERAQNPEQAPLQLVRRNGDFGHRKRTNLKFVA